MIESFPRTNVEKAPPNTRIHMDPLLGTEIVMLNEVADRLDQIPKMRKRYPGEINCRKAALFVSGEIDETQLRSQGETPAEKNLDRSMIVTQINEWVSKHPDHMVFTATEVINLIEKENYSYAYIHLLGSYNTQVIPDHTMFYHGYSTSGEHTVTELLGPQAESPLMTHNLVDALKDENDDVTLFVVVPTDLKV